MGSALWVLLAACIVACAGQAFDIKQHLGTKSPYPGGPTDTNPTPVPDGCSVVHLDLLARHGSREPTSGDIKALNKLASDLKTYGKYITNQTLAWMQNWTNPYQLINQGYLSYSGELEHYGLAKRAKALYAPLLSQEYFPNVYVIQSTQVSRTGVSASSYAFGFLEGEGALGTSNFEPIFAFTESANQDVTLRFFDVCQQYLNAEDNGTISSAQSDKYANMVYPAIAVEIANRLGVNGNWDISVADVETLFTACAFQASLDNNTAGFCDLFTPAEIEAYEFIDDLDDYYTSGYGAGFGYQISSPLLQDIVETMDNAIDSAPSVEKAYLRFAHAETLMPLISLLNLYKDSKPITADSTPDEIASRLWRGSKISPFAGNLLFALYQCDSGSTKSYKVKVLHNENEVQIPGCDSVYCDYTLFKETNTVAYGLNYNFSQVCDVPLPSPPRPSDDDVVMKKWQISLAFVFSFAITVLLVTTANTFYFKYKYKNLGYRSVSDL